MKKESKKHIFKLFLKSSLIPFFAIPLISTNPYLIQKLNNTLNASVTPEIDQNTINSKNLVPNANDLYNQYNFDNGYIVVSDDLSNPEITFYNWFKQKEWEFDLTTQISQIANKSIATLKVKQFNNSNVLVYGNTNDNCAYLFLIDSTSGTIVKNSLIISQSWINSNTLINDAI